MLLLFRLLARLCHDCFALATLLGLNDLLFILRERVLVEFLDQLDLIVKILHMFVMIFVDLVIEDVRLAKLLLPFIIKAGNSVL